jgi:hypothetical protein
MAISKAFLDRLYEARGRALAEVKRRDAERNQPQIAEDNPVKQAIADTREKLLYQMRVDDAENFDKLIALYLETHGQQSGQGAGR